MTTKIFGEKEIIIRSLSDKDLQQVEKIQEFINSLIKEEAKISLNKEVSVDEEKEFLVRTLKNVKSGKEVFLVAEHDNQVVGTTSVTLKPGRQSHVGQFGITIKDGYRGIGLGKYLMGEIIRLAQEELTSKPKIIWLDVYLNNKPAIALYESYGFKKVAEIPDQIDYKGELINLEVMLLYLS